VCSVVGVGGGARLVSMMLAVIRSVFAQYSGRHSSSCGSSSGFAQEVVAAAA
jgi:hypothetical protein